MRGRLTVLISDKQTQPRRTVDGTDLTHALEQHFGWREFRPLQREVIETVLNGQSALAVLPTGGGKSLCYQLPALVLPGMTLVVSPLISLMKDQVDALSARGVAAVAVNSQDTAAEMQRKLGDMAAGRVRIVYVAPERLKSGSFLAACTRVRIGLLAVDEAHCVSQWGHDFRPDYRLITDFRRAVGNPPLLALTATATRRVQADIVEHLGIEEAPQFLAHVDRPNLWLGMERCATVAEKRGKVVALAARAEGSTIVYVSSRRDAEAFAGLLEKELGEPVAAYHAGLDPDERTAVQNRFMTGLIRIVTATNAFGMGIDKPDIRAVIHAGVPDSIEAYFQEVGRAGRDGQPSECTMVVVPGMDVKTRQYLLEKDEPTQAQVDALLQPISRAAQQGESVVPLDERDGALGTLVLSHLQSLGAVELVQRTQSGMQVRALQPVTPDAARAVWNEVQQQSRAKRTRFARMRNFVYLETCRRRFLLDYFGEASPEEQAACCSACDPRPVEARAVARPVPKRTRTPLPAHEDVDAALLERLKAWRKAEADERGVPAYVVFGDRDLIGIAASAPGDLHALAACRGVGPTKLEMYGEKILSLVRETARDQRETARSAAASFEAGEAPAEVAVRLACAEDDVWNSFLDWVTHTSHEIWKEQVRRQLSPEAYVNIRTELRRRADEPFAEVLKGLRGRFDPREVTLTRAVMRRVGEV